jgi:hypothetical protein
MKKLKKGDNVGEEEAMILDSFLRFAERGDSRAISFTAESTTTTSMLPAIFQSRSLRTIGGRLEGMTWTRWSTIGFAGRRSSPASRNET